MMMSGYLNRCLLLISVLLLAFSCQQTPDDEYIPVSAVSLTPSSLEMSVGETSQLKFQISPSNATTQDAVWGSSKQSVATVSDSGLVTAKSQGNATITVSVDGKTASCQVTVENPTIDVASITLNKESIALVKGQTFSLKATVSPADATDKTVDWSSSDANVAKVEQDGTVTAIGGGSAIITASAGGKAVECSVTVTVPVENITLDRTDAELEEGGTLSLVATVLPDDATDKSVEWSSNKNDIAVVDAEGTVSAIKEGVATITAKNGEKSASCTITVNKKIIHVESIELSRKTLNIAVGATDALTATILPNDATDKSVTWSSTNKDIAEVDQAGNITAKANGTVTITATTVDGYLSDACEVTVFIPFVPVDNISLDHNNLALIKGQSVNLVATVTPTDATNQTVHWTSSDTNVVLVDQNGKVTANGGGSATITAEAGDKSADCIVTVTVPIEKIELSQTEAVLKEGESLVLEATVLPDDATDKSVTWESSNTEIATVDNNGKITAIAEGAVTIIAKAGDKTVYCTISICKKIISVTSVSLSKHSLSIIKGTTDELVATVLPEDASNKSVRWNSSNSSIAEVDQNGIITANSVGTTTITVTTIEGGFADACEVTVYIPYVPVTSITLDRSSAAMEKGQSLTLVATVFPTDASVKTVSWSSSNVNVANVNQDGLVTAVGGGNATITAKAGDLMSSCSITVTVPVQSISFDKESMDIAVGETAPLTATVLPNDATDKTITWDSSNQSIAAVDQNGLITANSPGTTTITAITTDGGFITSCEVSVYIPFIPVSSISLNKTSLTLNKGETASLVATVLPDNASNKEVEWSTSDASVAKIDPTGTVTAMGYGNATITAEAGGLSTTCSVMVKPSGQVYLDVADIVLHTHTSDWCSAQADYKVVETSTGTVLAEYQGTDDNRRFVITSYGASTYPQLFVYGYIDEPTYSCGADMQLGNNFLFRTDGAMYWHSHGETITDDIVFTYTVMQSIGGTTFTGVGNITILSSDHSSPTHAGHTGTPVSSVTLNRSSLTLVEGKTFTLEATVEPENATDKTVSWSSSNSAVATVDDEGIVTAISNGEATITVTTNDGEHTSSCNVTVFSPQVNISNDLGGYDYTSLPVTINGALNTLLDYVSLDISELRNAYNDPVLTYQVNGFSFNYSNNPSVILDQQAVLGASSTTFIFSPKNGYIDQYPTIRYNLLWNITIDNRSLAPVLNPDLVLYDAPGILAKTIIDPDPHIDTILAVNGKGPSALSDHLLTNSTSTSYGNLTFEINFQKSQLPTDSARIYSAGTEQYIMMVTPFQTYESFRDYVISVKIELNSGYVMLIKEYIVRFIDSYLGLSHSCINSDLPSGFMMGTFNVDTKVYVFVKRSDPMITLSRYELKHENIWT